MINGKTYNIILRDEDEQDFDGIYYIIRCKTLESVKELGDIVGKMKSDYYSNEDNFVEYSSIYDYIAENLPEKYDVLPIYDFLGA